MFVIRNYTIENLFPDGTLFSGYDDISFIPENEKLLVWFYQVPVGFDVVKQAMAVEAMEEKLQLVAKRLSPSQSLVICSLENMFHVNPNDSDNRLDVIVRQFNQRARGLAKSNPAIKFLDISEYISGFSRHEWINWRFYFISQMLFAPSVASGFREWFSRRLAQLDGSRKKCLILDLDNTLWGGVLGEDGIDGIKIGGDYPGNAFLYFQEAIINLSECGVILAVCSKNNESDVIEAWEKNPFIKLNRKYISAYRINWENKADNIRNIAEELNIGLDSMVFIDDNPSERELVRRELPMVAVPDFPGKPYGLMELYQNLVDNYFRIYRLTAEDRNKTEQYKANAERANVCRQFSNLTDFIRNLGITIQIIPADRFNISRISQMTQKTNQFNLTTHRYTEADIRTFADKGDYVYCISVSDRFGDNGITGAAIITRIGNKASIDSFLLSCRILGKGIESIFFKALMNKLKQDGIESVDATYIPTNKNSQVSDFYLKEGMTCLDEQNGIKKYSLKLSNYYTLPDYYTINPI